MTGDAAAHGGSFSVHLDASGVVRLTASPGLRITGELAREVIETVDGINAGSERPLLVDIAGTAGLTREARSTFTRRSSASRIALLGRSAVDRVVANFALGRQTVPVPTRFFTSAPDALDWLRRDAPGP